MKKPNPTQAWRDFCRAITLDDETTMARLRKEMQNGTMNPSLQQAVWHYAFGVPPKEIKLTTEERGRPTLRTRNPIGYDPLNPGNPNVTVIENIYGHVPELPAATEPPADDPESTEAPAQSIVPHPEVVKDEPRARRPRPKKPPEDDGSTPLRVDGV